MYSFSEDEYPFLWGRSDAKRIKLPPLGRGLDCRSDDVSGGRHVWPQDTYISMADKMGQKVQPRPRNGMCEERCG